MCLDKFYKLLTIIYLNTLHLIIINPQFYPQTFWQLTMFNTITNVNFIFPQKIIKFDSCKLANNEL
ncbi:hypothetical protein J3D55_002930 [Chryseobacterium ginsenosidimutans]|nr:hypothetical protein [Chryseobacterium ginsenosidimutans]